MAEKPFFKKTKNGRFGGPWAGRIGRMGQKGVAKFRFGPRRTSGASFVKIGLGSWTVLRPSLVQSLLSTRELYKRDEASVSYNVDIHYMCIQGISISTNR